MDENKKKELSKHKARIFDENSYYYLKLDKNDISKGINITQNAVRLAKEFDNQKKNFLESLDIEKYLRTKDMIKEYNGGTMLNHFTIKNEGSKKKLF